jgi:hypothetical protein
MIAPIETPLVPSLRRVARSTGVAAAVAGVLLVTFVLPAEYAIDPLGTGRMLGLTSIAAPPLGPVEAPPQGDLLVPTVNGPASRYPTGFKTDRVEITLAPYEYVEYKYRLEQGASMMYAWASSAAVLQDFHGERADKTTGPAEESYDKRDRDRDAGSFAAPFAGIHGWYWENPGADNVTITLVTAGFFSSATEIRSDRSRHPHLLADPWEAAGKEKSGTQEEK